MRDYENLEKSEWIDKFTTQVAATIDNQQIIQMLEENYLIDEKNDPEGLDEYGKLDQFCIKLILDIEEIINFIKNTKDYVRKLKLMTIMTQSVYFR